MLVPSFQLTLPDPIRERRATVGDLYEGQACFACATTGGQILVHNPHEIPGGGVDKNHYVRINRDVTALASGRMHTEARRKDHLMIGTSSSLQAFDCEDNRDLFFADVPDGSNAVVVDKVSTFDEPLALVGGYGALLAYDSSGTERMWTVTSNSVTALATADVDGDGQKEILVGTDDADIMVFKNEERVATMAEMDSVTSLAPVEGGRFAYALNNGTTGIYNRDRRAWRVKSRHRPVVVKAFDLDGDGVPELVSGWSNGKLEVRSEGNGQMVFKDTLSESISDVVLGDLRRKGKDEIIICGTDGEVRGYEGAVDEQRALMVANARKLAALTQQKQKLVAQLEQAELAEKKLRDKEAQKAAQASQDGQSLPPGTKVLVEWQTSEALDALNLFVEASSNCVIRSIVLMAEGIFVNRESLVYTPDRPTRNASVPIRTLKDTSAIVHIKVFLANNPSSPVVHIYETDLDLPKFAMYSVVNREAMPREPEGYVTFAVEERVQRIALWIESAFNAKLPSLQNTQKIEAAFVSLRDQAYSLIRTKPMAGGNEVIIHTDNMTLAGDMVQDLCRYLQITELISEAYFPAEMEKLGVVLDQVAEYNTNRMKFHGEAADASNMVKAMAVRAEDSRLIQDFDGMLGAYARLQEVNRDLLIEHEKRATNHKNLLDGLRHINGAIQAAARLRLGQASTDVVAQCRNAIRQDQFASLFIIMQRGVAR